MFRNKPVVIEAVRYLGPQSKAAIEAFANGYFRWVPGWGGHGPVLFIGAIEGTVEGAMRVYVGDWIIKGVKGDFYPCNHDIFGLTYESIPNHFEDCARRLGTSRNCDCKDQQEAGEQ